MAIVTLEEEDTRLSDKGMEAFAYLKNFFTYMALGEFDADLKKLKSTCFNFKKNSINKKSKRNFKIQSSTMNHNKTFPVDILSVKLYTQLLLVLYNYVSYDDDGKGLVQTRGRMQGLQEGVKLVMLVV